MIILAISTSSNNASVALLENNICIKELNIVNEKTHSEKLMPLIDELFSSTGLSLSNVSLIACDNGPGSFTGLRIGIATVKALAEVKNLPVVGISSLDALSYNVLHSNYTCSLIDARNNQVYCAIFDTNHNLISDYMADDINNLLPIFEKYNNISFVGDGYNNHKDLFNQSTIYDDIIYSKNIGICAYKKFVNGETTTPDLLSVMYLRKSQAERMLKVEK